MCRIMMMMMTLTMRAFFLLSLFAFLGTRARNLPAGVDDKFKTNDGDYDDIQIISMTANYGKELAKAKLPAPYTAAPSKKYSSSCLTAGSSCNTMIVEHKPSLHPPPPPETGGGEHYLSPKRPEPDMVI